MRTLTAIGWTARGVRHTAVGWGLITVLACVALSACTGTGTGTTTGTTSPSASVSILSPSASGSASESASASESESPTPSESASPSPTPSLSPSPTPSFSPIPTAAPVTGGGGTAGFQDAGLAVLGGAAILVGLGSIAYRRRITRRR